MHASPKTISYDKTVDTNRNSTERDRYYASPTLRIWNKYLKSCLPCTKRYQLATCRYILFPVGTCSNSQPTSNKTTRPYCIKNVQEYFTPPEGLWL